jgi:hypothetical protein
MANGLSQGVPTSSWNLSSPMEESDEGVFIMSKGGNIIAQFVLLFVVPRVFGKLGFEKKIVAVVNTNGYAS